MSIPTLGFGGWGESLACYSTEMAPYSVIYPKGSGLSYMSGSILVGGVLDSDSLVSQDDYAEFRQFDLAVIRTINETLPFYSSEAKSEQDIIVEATDTSWWDVSWVLPPDDRPPKPLHIEVMQTSYAWSYEYAEDFILFKMQIRNIGDKLIKGACFGISIQPDGRYIPSHDTCCTDDLAGFIRTYYASVGCNRTDTLNIMWAADDDVYPVNGVLVYKPVYSHCRFQKSSTSVTGVMFLDWPRGIEYHPHISYNWWYGWAPLIPSDNDFIPQHKDNFHPWTRPFTDKLLYYQMVNGEIDYDQAYAATVTPFDRVWTAPRQEIGRLIATSGSSVWQLLSIGPFDISPGATLEIPFAYIAGEHFHYDPNNGVNLPDNPEEYYRHLDYSDLAKNSQWARWVYDTPGFDSDSDGYAGEYQICALDSEFVNGHWVVTAADTVYYQGDGIPDWKAAGPPPAPFVSVQPIVGGLRVRFNGSRSETEKDIFSKIVDFEGYRVYFGRDDRIGSFSLVGSYDRANFDKYVWDPNRGEYTLRDIPFTLDSLKCLYGNGPVPCIDSIFDPSSYTRTYPYSPPLFPDSMFFFVEHDNNTSDFGIDTPVHKVYTEEPDPRTLPVDSLTPDRYTSDGNFKYFEYEMEITDLLPTVPYWVSVTAFDFGSPTSTLRPLESSVVNNSRSAFPYATEDELPGRSHEIYVYPNPYRIDAQYRANGYEGRTREDRPDYRVRAVNFANLPHRCTISIYTLDVHQVRRLEHDFTEGDTK